MHYIHWMGPSALWADLRPRNGTFLPLHLSLQSSGKSPNITRVRKPSKTIWAVAREQK